MTGTVRDICRRAAAAAGCAVAVLLAGGAPAGAQPPAAAADPTAVDRYLAASRAAIRIPGMAVAITRGGEVV